MPALTGRRWVACTRSTTLITRCHNHPDCAAVAQAYWDDHLVKHRIYFNANQEAS